MRRSKDLDLPFWLGLLLYLALYAVLGAGPMLLSIHVHLWAGVAAAVLAIAVWMFLGPRPGPGFVAGTLASGGLVGLIVLAVVVLVGAAFGISRMTSDGESTSGVPVGRQPEPAWRTPLEEAKRAATAQDWKNASMALAEAKARGAPAVEIPATLSEGVAAYEGPARLEVTEPSEGAEVEGTKLVVKGRLASGRPTDRVFVGGRETAVVGGAFEAEVGLARRGPATVTVVVRDGAEERARVVRRVVAREPPRPDPPPTWAKVSAEQVEAARSAGVPVAFENDLGMRFVLVPSGRFTMGSPESEGGDLAERRQHEVRLTRPFYVQVTEVTNWQYRRKEGGHHCEGKLDGDRQPVVEVSWNDATAFATWLSSRDPGHTYRLPTEAEWEYACRAGTRTPFWYGETISTDQANYDGNYVYGTGRQGEHRQRTTEVGSFSPNGWGLYDMHGNVWEWCQDGERVYSTSPVVDPVGPSEPSAARVVRGGSFDFDPRCVRSAYRLGFDPDDRDYNAGFRLVASVPPPGGR